MLMYLKKTTLLFSKKPFSARKMSLNLTDTKVSQPLLKLFHAFWRSISRGLVTMWIRNKFIQ